MKLSKTLLALTATLGLSTAAHSAVIVDATIVGNDVVFEGSGTLNTNGLSLSPFSPVPNAASVAPLFSELSIGPSGAQPWDNYGGIFSGPTNFGPGNPTPMDSGSGDRVIISPLGGLLGVPVGYVSGAALNSTSIINGATFDTLGMSRGQYVWTWGSGANADSFTLNVIPAPLPLALLATGGLIGLGLRKKLKA